MRKLFGGADRGGADRGGRAGPRRPDDPHWMLPPAAPDPELLRVTFLGVSTLLIQDGETALLVDGFFSRPGKVRTLLGRIAPDPAIIDRSLRRAGITRLAAVIVGHSHYDHVMDAPVVAARTGAVLVGSPSTRMVALGVRQSAGDALQSAGGAGRGPSAGLDDSRILVPAEGEPLAFGRFTVTLIRSEHVPPHRFSGELTHPVTPPVRASTYRMGRCHSLLFAHDQGRILVQGSAGFRSGALVRQQADVAYLGIGTLARQPQDYQERYWRETVGTVGARRVLPIHWDDFWRPLHEPLVPLPALVDDIPRALDFLYAKASAAGIDLRLPTAWQPTDPFVGLPSGEPRPAVCASGPDRQPGSAAGEPGPGTDRRQQGGSAA
ncbi:MBL fold metallo-hydrolase [Micromonospora polyrhachis]|uniref:L-ascorbate metabolism protein UlaG (Beta-lactamase superfamily) n=1 Tax=Micromonospora polyrhachis TaxID=1282883 RepID=A0A7W7WQJ3_9ACTN|nr:MBL fold metallo-hydrolase [Micromonospora polyrhachis]MBB4960331.1 L-ascorbate metabolism protein UlaG (beta-lactamase superfamily) [Micromonospora polyrhachis]